MYHQLDDDDDGGLTDMVRALLPSTIQAAKSTPHTRHAPPTAAVVTPNDNNIYSDDECYYTPPSSRTREVSPSKHAASSSPLRHTIHNHTPTQTTSPPTSSGVYDVQSPLPYQHRVVAPPRTYISGRLNTISNKYCRGGIGPTLDAAGQSPPAPKLQGITYTDRRQELYALMGYDSAFPAATSTTTTSVSPVRGGSPYYRNRVPDHSPAIRRPDAGEGSGSTPPLLLQYHSPQGSRIRGDTSTPRLPSEMPLKAPSVSYSPLLVRQRHSSSHPTNNNNTTSHPPTILPLTSIRLLGKGSGCGGELSRCRGTKAGPSAEVAAARSLFALLVAEEERVGSALRSEARKAAATS